MLPSFNRSGQQVCSIPLTSWSSYRPPCLNEENIGRETWRTTWVNARMCPTLSPPDSLHWSVLTGLCMSAPHHDTLKHLGRYVTCAVVFADFNGLGLLLPVYLHPSGKPSSFCPGLGPAQGSCWFPVAEDGCSLTSCPGNVIKLGWAICL